jgi:hypothetical protein
VIRDSCGSVHRAQHRSGIPPKSSRRCEVPVPIKVSRAAAVRVLVVEDFAEFRRFVSDALATRPDLQIIGETADGLEAVPRALN